MKDAYTGNNEHSTPWSNNPWLSAIATDSDPVQLVISIHHYNKSTTFINMIYFYTAHFETKLWFSSQPSLTEYSSFRLKC